MLCYIIFTAEFLSILKFFNHYVFYMLFLVMRHRVNRS